jgi:hypothetical protein
MTRAAQACAILLLVFGAHACSSRFSGLIQVILSLAELTRALEDDVKERLPKTSKRFVFHHIFHSMLRQMWDRDLLEIIRTEDKDAIVARGRILWNSIYDPYADKLHDKLSSYHPDFMGEYMRAHITTIPPLLFVLFFISSARDRSDQQQRPILRTSLLRRRETVLGLPSRTNGTRENRSWFCSSLTLSSVIHLRSTVDLRECFLLLPGYVPLRHSPLWSHS